MTRKVNYMKRFKIIHRTYYNYTGKVSLGDQVLLLRPRENHELRIESFALTINPAADVRWYRDIEGNSVAVANFSQTESTQQLLVESETVIQQNNETPLNFLVADDALNYPFAYHADDFVMLSPYLTLPIASEREEINQWIKKIWQPDEHIQTYSLLLRIARTIFESQTYNVREEPGVQTSVETLSSCSGSCRDFSKLFMDATRCLGLASRFVSGYLNAPLMSAMVGATHAWTEVYLPGAGWKGFDPTIGDIVGPDHIAVAVASRPESVPPISGSYLGSETSTMDVGVWVSEI
jgi:transglutaminase-like putative cysteine protease